MLSMFTMFDGISATYVSFLISLLVFFFLLRSVCKIMGSEIDTKSIEPVRNAVSLFGDKSDQKKYQTARSKVR